MSLWTWMATLNWRGVLCDKIAMSMGLHLLKTLAPFLCLFLWVPPVLSMGEVYQWTDSRGVIHFTDNYQLVPEPLKDTPRLIVREDFLTEGEFSEASPQFEYQRQGPVPEPQAPEVKRFPVPEPVRVIPQVIDNSQHYNTIVVVNSFATRQFARRCLQPNGCRPVFRPNFRDRRYIHPSVFGRGSRQYIRPGSFQ